MEEHTNGFHWNMLRQELPFIGVGLLFLVPFLYGSLGLSSRFFTLLLFSGFLLFLSAIDIRCGMIFNRFLLPMAVTGLLLDFAGLHIHPMNGCLAGIAGGCLLFLIRWGSNGGLGGGDVKLGIVLGIWLGIQDLAVALFLAFLAGASIGLLLMLRHGTAQLRIPFGPFLSFGSWLAALYGDELIRLYENLFSITP